MDGLFLWLPPIWILLLLLWTPPIRAAESAARRHRDGPRILLLNSYAPNVRWSIELTNGVREGIMAHFPNAGLVVEHWPDDASSVDEAENIVAEKTRTLNREHLFTVAIIADDAAYHFALKYHHRVLPGVPLVFCGVANVLPSELEDHRLMTGIIQLPDLKKPLTTALLRQKCFTRLVVIHDVTSAGLAYRRQVENLLPELKRIRPNIRVAFLSGGDLSTKAMIERVRQLPLDCFILFTVWHYGMRGESLPRNELLAHLSSVSPVPVYSVTDLAGEFDTSRERLRQAHRQGLAAAGVAVKILQGIPPSEIPVRVFSDSDTEPPSREMTDAGQANPVAPSASPPSRTRASPLFVVALGIALVLLLLLAVVLAMVYRKWHRAQRNLEKTQRERALLTDCARLGVFEWDIISGAFHVNAHYAEMLGWQPADIGPTFQAWQQLVHPDDLQRVLEALSTYLEDSSTVFEARYRMRTSNGTYRWVLARGETLKRTAHGTPASLLGIHMDIDGIVDLFAGFDVE